MNLDVWLSNAGLKTLNRNHPNVTLLKGEGPIEYVHRMMDDTGGAFRVFNGRGGLELPNSIRPGCAGLIPAPDCADVMARIFDMFAHRIGLAEVHPRHPCVMPSTFGLDIIRRYGAALPDLVDRQP